MNRKELIDQTYLTLLKVAVSNSKLSAKDLQDETEKQTASALGENLGQLASFIGSAAYDEIEALSDG